MMNGEGTREAASPDPFDSFPALRVRQSDRDDASHASSRYSSCGESDFDRYCSANSVMGTPSMCSSITVFNDFPEFDFGSAKSFGSGGDNGLENFSLGERVEMSHKDRRLSTSSGSDSMRDFRTGFGSENIRNQQNLRYGSSGLELYGNDNDELTMTMLDASSLMGVNQSDKILEGEKVLENMSLGDRVEMTHKDEKLSTSSGLDGMRDFRTGIGGENIRRRQNLKYGSCGLELYGDDNDGLTMTMLDASGLMVVNQSDKILDQDFVHKDVVEGSEVFRGHAKLGEVEDYFETMSSDADDNAGNTETYLSSIADEKCSLSEITAGEGALSCAADKGDEFDSLDAPSNLQIDERGMKREEDGNSSIGEHSEGEDSIYNYGGNDDNKNVFCLSRSIYHHQESKVQHENPLLINSSVAFGSEDLDDFLLENKGNGQVSQMFDVFHSQEEKVPKTNKSPVNFSSVSSTGTSNAGQKAEGKDGNDMVMFNKKVEERKDLGNPKEVGVVRDFPAASCPVEGVAEVTDIKENSSNASSDFPNKAISHQEDVGEIIIAKNNCPKACSITKAFEVDLDPLAEEDPQHMDLNVTDGGTIEKENENINTKEAFGSSNVQHVENPELDKSKFKLDHFSASKVEHKFSSSTEQLGKINEESLKNLEKTGHFSNYGMRKTLESSPTSKGLFEKSPMTSQVST